MSGPGWIGVDFDGTLAKYPGGEPVPLMVMRVKRYLRAGIEVRIVTARVSKDEEHVDVQRALIESWCREHIGAVLPVTNEKDYSMIELWDDRARRVEKNTGRIIG